MPRPNDTDARAAVTAAPTAPVAAASDAAADPDDDALRAWIAGDAGAFEALYRRHQAGLYRFVRRLLGHAGAGLVDEVYQDTWLRLVQSRERWAPQGASFRTWLYTLAHHRAIDCLRRHGREVSIDAREDDDASAPWSPEGAAAWDGWPAPDAPDIEDRAFWRAAGQRLLDCLETLPLAQRSAFLLHHEDGLAVDAIAQALDLGFETVKSRLRYAMTKLRTCMGAYLPPEFGR